MKCEICHAADAGAVIHRKGKDGEDRELFVCKACAAKARRQKQQRARAEGDGSEAKELEVPPPVVKEIVEATFGLMKCLAEAEAKAEAHQRQTEEALKDCPVCGRSLEEIKETHRAGCPSCWNVFAKELREAFFGAQYGTKHVGDAPRFGGRADPRTALRRDLKKAVAAQNFEKAAELRRRLDELDAAEKGGKDAAR